MEAVRTVLVLIGPVATEPVELGPRVASSREFQQRMQATLHRLEAVLP